MSKKRFNLMRRAPPGTSWDPVARWYNGWVGKNGSKHHHKLAIPAVLELLCPQPGMKVLDIGTGQGVLAPYITKLGGIYTGVDISERLLRFAHKHHRNEGRFIIGDARRLSEMPELHPGEFDAVVFLLSLQDMEPLPAVLKSASWALKDRGHAVILMTHPCFRIPRLSGWGWDEERKLQYRRIDRYLTALSIPMPVEPEGVTLSFHRPLSQYVNSLAEYGLVVDRMQEIPTYKVHTSGQRSRAQNLANREIPLFLGMRAVKIET